MREIPDMESKYIVFILDEIKPKTLIFRLESKSHGDLLGHIKWYGPWRQYCFFTQPETIFAKGCMNDIIKFIERLMEERKK